MTSGWILASNPSPTPSPIPHQEKTVNAPRRVNVVSGLTKSFDLSTNGK